MRKFKGNRPLDDVIQIAESSGWLVDMEVFEKGSDYIYLRDMFGQAPSNDEFPRQVAYNTTNGHFFVYEPLTDKPVATHMSESLDDEPWYKALLDMFYLPKKEELAQEQEEEK